MLPKRSAMICHPEMQWFLPLYLHLVMLCCCKIACDQNRSTLVIAFRYSVYGENDNIWIWQKVPSCYIHKYMWCFLDINEKILAARLQPWIVTQFYTFISFAPNIIRTLGSCRFDPTLASSCAKPVSLVFAYSGQVSICQLYRFVADSLALVKREWKLFMVIHFKCYFMASLWKLNLKLIIMLTYTPTIE